MVKLEEFVIDPQLRGFTTVRVDKQRLVGTIQANREDHRRIFEEALDGWQQQVTKDLEQAAKEAKAGRSFQIRFNLPQPTDHTDSYDAILALLDFSLDTEYELTFQEFQNYVRDEWGWQTDFLVTSANYGSFSAFDKGSDMGLGQFKAPDAFPELKKKQ